MNGDSVILLVEDEPRDEALTKRALQRANLKNPIEVAHDGVEALDYIFGTGPFEGRKPPELVLLDLKLPKIGGLEVLARLRADPRTRLLPVVILTSSDEERDRLAGYEHGANSYVRKPVNFNEFSEAVRQLGLYWVVVNLPPPRTSPPPPR